MQLIPAFKVVVLEDDDFYNRMLSHFLNKSLGEIGLLKGFTVNVSSYTSYNDCMRNFDEQTHLVFTDYYLRDGYSAPLVLQRILSLNEACKVVVISQITNIQTSIATLLDGAYDFIKKDKNSLNNCRDLAASVLLEKLTAKSN